MRAHPWRWLIRALSLLVSCCFAWAGLIEPGCTTYPEHTLHLAGWPESHDGLRVMVLADLHAGAPQVDLQRVEELVRQIDARSPDLILVPGDVLITGVVGGRFLPPAEVARALAPLRAPWGVYAVLGNHDANHRRALSAALNSAGVVLLENRARRVERDGRALWIAGVSDLWTDTPDVAKAVATATDSAPLILLSHNPDIFPQVPARVQLTVAAHTHGGQVSLPLYGPIFTASQFDRRYLRGLVVEEGRSLFVSSGVGTSILPLRFGVVPEVPLLILRAH